MAEQPEVGERRVGGDGADTWILGRGEEGDRAPEREAEDADRADAARRQEIEGAPEVPALLEAERRQAPLAPAEVALVEEEDGEAGGQPGRDRQHVGTVGRIAVQEDDGRRARAWGEPRREPEPVVGRDRHVLDHEPEVPGRQRHGEPRRPDGEPEDEEARADEAGDEPRRVEDEPHVGMLESGLAGGNGPGFRAWAPAGPNPSNRAST